MGRPNLPPGTYNVKMGPDGQPDWTTAVPSPTGTARISPRGAPVGPPVPASASIAGHLQITMGHHPERGWEIAAPIIIGGFITCPDRFAADKLKQALLDAYALGGNDVRREIANVLKVK